MISEKHRLSHPHYRPDIDGLRAVAVLAVVAFHAFPARFPGGFVGVDIFFVISGFLISGILFENLEHGTFSFLEFYGRRIRRIFPALALVLLSCLVFGWFVLLADEYQQLGKHVTGGAGFVANFVNWHESGYFDKAADKKPLLHLWSLGIEEQFYIIWPLLLWVGWKKKWNMLTLTASACIISFALNMKEVHVDPVATFYSPQTRFWELLCGSLLAWAPLHAGARAGNFWLRVDSVLARAVYREAPDGDGKTLRNAASLAGLALLCYGLYRLSEDTPFPGGWALVPVVGALLLIAAGPAAVVNRRLLSNRVMVWVGAISYPLYLWHYPLLSFARIIASDTPGRNVRFAAVALAFVLAWITYRIVERPLRFGERGGAKSLALLALMLLIGCCGYGVRRADGFNTREVIAINPSIDSGKDGGDGGNTVNECGIVDQAEKELFHSCTRDKRETPVFALMGDSKAEVLAPGLYRTSLPGGRWMFIGGSGAHGAPTPMLWDSGWYLHFKQLTEIAVKTINEQKQIKTVLLVAATRSMFNLHTDRDLESLSSNPDYASSLEGLDRTVTAFVKAGKKVVLLVDGPTLPPPEDCLNRKTALPLVDQALVTVNEKCTISLSRHLELTKRYRALLEEVRTRHPGEVSMFDSLPYMCDSARNVCEPYKNGRRLYAYTDHMSDYAGGLIAADLNKLLNAP